MTLMRKSDVSLALIAAALVICFPTWASGQIVATVPERTRPDLPPLLGRFPAGSITTGQATAPSAAGSDVNTLNTSIQIQGDFQGSTPSGTASRDPLPLSLDDAIKRGLAYNLGVIGSQEAERQARAQRLSALAKLLPDINAIGTVAVQQVSLSTIGLQSAKGIPGLEFAKVLGPFN